MSPNIVCISHGEDVDGITCAALLKRLKGARPILVTYDDFHETLQGITPPLDALYICDLNIREDLLDEILRIRGFTGITVIDHHPASELVLEKLTAAGVEVVHDTRDCASVLLYDHFSEELGREAGRMAAYAIWADQFEDGPLAIELLKEYDRQSVQHEALLLAHALTQRPTHEFRTLVMDEVSRLTPPHRIPGASEAAVAYLEEMILLAETLKQSSIRMKVLAHFEADEEMPIGSIAGFVTDALGVKVGLCHKRVQSLVNLSVRGRRGINFHLGEMTRSIASKYGGFGGGHKRASGASIPAGALEGFLRDLDDELATYEE